MKYEKGDKVRVKSDLVALMTYDNGIAFASEMNKYKGNIYTIVGVDEEHRHYELEGTASYSFSEDMVDHDAPPQSFSITVTKDDVSDYLKKLSETFPFQKIFVTGLQIRNNVLDFPSNIIKVSSSLDFSKMLKKL